MFVSFIQLRNTLCVWWSASNCGTINYKNPITNAGTVKIN